jgi:protein-export membrane protein SecD
LWDEAVEARDRFAGVIRETLEREGVDALVLLSHAGNYPPWARLEAWVPAAAVRSTQHLRSELQVTVDVRPYREHKLVHTVRLTRGKEQRAISEQPGPHFTTTEAREWTLYALGRGPRPSNYHPVVDRLTHLIAVLLPFVRELQHNPFEGRFKNVLSLNGAKCLFLGSIILALIGSLVGVASVFGVLQMQLGVAGLVGSWLIARHRTQRIGIPEQPTEAPRNLRLVDSWHTAIAGLASEHIEAMRQLAHQISAAEPAGIRCRSETYGYRTPNGYEQRDRLVVSKGQAIVHVHIYPFGDDIFIGWHAYLNCAQWGETAAVSRRVVTGAATEFRDLRPERHVPNQFDLFDLNGLSELVHRTLEQEIKQLVIDNDIDQEVDFEIVRGDRSRALDPVLAFAETEADSTLYFANWKITETDGTLYFANWKITLVCAACAFGVLLSLPNLFSPSVLVQLPRFFPHKQVALGLDLRGGSYLLLEVDVAGVQRERLNSLIDDVRNVLRDVNIGYTGLNVQGDAIVFTIREPDRVEDARQALRTIDRDLTVDIASDRSGTMRFSAIATEARRHQVVDQSIEIIRRRIDETGTKEPTIQREGLDRILVRLPGVDNPERVKALLGRTAKLTFQLVDTSLSLEDARRGRLPPADQILPTEEGRAGRVGPPAYVVHKRVVVGGDTLVDAQPTFQNNEPVVSFRFDAAGAKRFGDATRENVGKPFAIVLDNKVISAPVIREPILGGSGIISGSFTVQSASDLALLLRAGALPAPITILEERTVGPDLGADSLHAGAVASIVGALLVAVFMILFYGLFGAFADIALFLNLCLMLGSLSLLGATLTLPGIAGIGLTMGMAVDADVLIYERIREQLRAGRTMLYALDAAFKRAFATILDSHVTILVAGLLMFWLGSGPVKGFAVTLSIGVLTSLFSAILVTRLLIIIWLRQWKPKAIPI